jgi:hypothetical protein
MALEISLPTEYFAVWRCIGCGAMGNSKPCTGTCDHRKLELVRSTEYAELYEEATAVVEQVKGLLAVVEHIAALPREGEEMTSSYRFLQNRARDVVRDLVPAQNTPLPAAERSLVWRCSTCDQIEAPQECLEICIRPVEEYVCASHYDELMGLVTAGRTQSRTLCALVRQLAWASPRAGQWERTLQAFQGQARSLLNAPEGNQILRLIPGAPGLMPS